MEDKVINHVCHEHPLILTENVGNKETLCYGCRNPVILESAYVCSQHYCLSKPILHKKCAELPRQIMHSSHPQHPLHLFDYNQKMGQTCSLCYANLEGVLGYRCSSCNFDFDLSCKQLGCIDLLEKKRLQHPSHYHALTLMRKPPFLFHCDGCGTKDCDMAYVCSACEFWIHKTCASLPITLPTNLHHHQLSLAFCFPTEYNEFEYNCDICHKGVNITCWVYYCRVCRYFAHVKCATLSEAIKEEPNLNIEENDGANLIQFPVHDISKELITPFVIRENGFDKIPDIKDMPASVTMPATPKIFSLFFNYHTHPLNLVTEGALNDELMMMICDLCITPIYSPPYYSCAACKYFLHSTCYFLPKTLSLHTQLYGHCLPTCQNHKLTTRYTSSKLDDEDNPANCRLCNFWGHGMIYGCEDCELRIDVKCASLPTTIKHAFHPQHKLIMRRIPTEERNRQCEACGCTFNYDSAIVAYYCSNDDCGFALGLDCVPLLPSIKHKWEKHSLLLTYDASIDHPNDFYCEVCEEVIHPKRWMYHCRECDNSFHTYCLTLSGYYRNVKYGRQVEFDHLIHPHPLTFNEVTLKLRCDICWKNVYSKPGFECASCNYVICKRCGVSAY